MTGLAALLAEAGLVALATFQPSPGLRPDPACRSLVLVGPDGGKFWPIFIASAEYRDRRPNPLDRWTKRIIAPIARRTAARAYFPFGTSPVRPFVAWALDSRQIWQSPVGLLVHGRHGLDVSFRAALAFDAVLDMPASAGSPCETCDGKPCQTACPVGALVPGGYDLPRCHGFLDSPAGRDCLMQGCQVRRSCPVGQKLHDPSRAAFHMAAFHRK